MNADGEKPMAGNFHAVSLSGGKDSTAMLLLMIERDKPIDLVLTADTGMEFPEISVHLKKALSKKLTVTGVTNDYEQSAAAINLLVNKAVDFSALTGEEKSAADIQAMFAAKAELLEKDKRVSPSILNMM